MTGIEPAGVRLEARCPTVEAASAGSGRTDTTVDLLVGNEMLCH
jgi:hypothetical protein